MQSDLQRRILEAASNGERSVNEMCQEELQKGLDSLEAKTAARLEYLNNSQPVGPDYRH
jgi:hypothetical protein